MVKSKNILKRALALLLVVIFIAAIPLSANADSITVNMQQCIDSNGKPMVYVANVYNKDGKLVFGGNGLYKVRAIYVGEKIDKNRAYCIDPGSPLNQDNTLGISEIWRSFSKDKRESINLALLYGMGGSADKLVGNSDEKYIATQLIIWELVDDYRNLWTSDFKCTNYSYYNCLCSNGSYPNVAKNYKIISDALEKHKTHPSFSARSQVTAPTLTLNWDGSKYTTTVEDKNGVLDKFDFSAEGIEFTKNGNNLTISSANFIEDSVTASSEKLVPQPQYASNLVAYGDLTRQDIIVGTSKSDPPMAYFKLETTESQLKIVKRDKETGKTIPLEGFGFKITDIRGNYLKDGNTDTWYTDITGSVSLPLTLDMGTYYIEEVSAAGDYTVNPEKQKFEIDGESPIVVADFYDTVEKGSVELLKVGRGLTTISEVTLEDGTVLHQPVWGSSVALSDAVFAIYAAEDIITADGTVRHKDGDLVQDNLEVDSNGKLTISDLYFGTYEIVETKAPSGYMLNSFPVEVTIDKEHKTSGTTVSNYPRGLRAQLTKQMEQDEANLIDTKKEVQKVSYGLYSELPYIAPDGTRLNANDLIDIAYANENGLISFKTFLPIGRYYIKELTTSEYYVLDDTKHSFKISSITDPETETMMIKNLGTFTNDVTTTPVVARKVAYDTGLPLAGAEIEVYSENGSLVYTGISNADGYFDNFPQLIKGTYTYNEITAPTGYLLDENTYTFEVSGDEEQIDLVIEDELITGSVKILKTGEIFSSVTTNTDEEGTTTYIPNFKNGSLEGAKFEIVADGDIVTPDGTIRYKDGEAAAELTTGKDGTAEVDDLYLGNYIIREVEAPKGYSISFDEIKITLSAEYTFVTTDPIENTRNKVNVKLNKTMEVDPLGLVDAQNEIRSVAFGIFADEKITGADGSFIPENGLIEKLYCDENGDISFSADLPNGKFYLLEMETSKYYKLDETKHCFEVDNNSKELTIDLTKDGPFINDLITTPIEIKKVAKDTGLPLEGAEIEISSSEGKVIYTGTTQADGKLEGVPELPIGTYNYREITAPDGYFIDTNVYTFEVTGNEEIIELVLEDEIILGKITVVKVGERFTDVKEETDSDGITTYQPEYNEGSLEGAAFEIVADGDIITPDGTVRHKDGDVVETLITGEDGTAEAENLYLGNYIVRETKSPDEYDLEEIEIPVTLTSESHIITTNPIKNSRHKVTISLTKTMENDQWDLIDTKAEVQKVAFGIFANEDIVADNGSYIPKDGLIQKLNCDENGSIQFSVALPFGSYYVEEMETSEYYILDETKHHFTIDYNVDTTAGINIDLNESDEFYNQWDKTQIDFKKVAKNTTSPLEGCEIEISHENGTVVYKGTTGTNGKLANVPQLPHGTYTYKEITAPDGYLLDENTYTFEIDGTKKVIELVMENVPITGGIEITKTDITTDKALPNCGIRLLDENGNVLREKRTDSNGKVLFDKLEAGIYYYQEFDAPEGYQINTEKFKFEIKENGVIIKAVLKDEKIPETPSTPTTPTTPGTPVTPNTPETPKVTTGQAVHTSAFVITLLISSGIIFITRKKMNRLAEEGAENTEGGEE